MDTLMAGVQSTVGMLIPFPALLPELLQRAAFRYLHEIICAVVNTTGFAQGLYSDDEMNINTIDDRAKKDAFLAKMVRLLELCKKEPLNINASDIVDGDAKSACRMLLYLGQCAGDSELDSTEAVVQCLYTADEDNAPMNVTAENDANTSVLSYFLELTGCPTETAQHLLEASNWDISAAMELYLETQGGGPAPMSQEDTAAADIIPEPSPGSPRVRAPDPVREDRLVQDSIMMRRREMEFSRAEDPSVEWMFAPPRHLSYPGNFNELRQLAQSSNKWILINIQDHTEFSSHLLNRDVWTNENIVSVIRMNFLFWQRGSSSMDGMKCITQYHLEHALPFIGIIDHRTGAVVFSLKGLVDASELFIHLVEFLDENSLDNHDPPKIRHNALSSTPSATRNSTPASSSLATSPMTTSSTAVSPEQHVAAEPFVAIVEEDYGPVPEEATGEDAVTISLKTPSEKAPKTRSFNKTHLVREVFAFAKSLEMEAAIGRPFDLYTPYPRTSLSARLNDTIDEADIKGTRLIMQWKE